MVSRIKENREENFVEGLRIKTLTCLTFTQEP